MKQWHDISYLRKGTAHQQQVYTVLMSLDIFAHLAAFHPLLVGTYPLNISIEGSDVDIVCEVHDGNHFEKRVRVTYGNKLNYMAYRTTVRGVPATIVTFVYNALIIELFGQPIASHEQYGYKHMMIEDWLLTYGGEQARKAIIALKKDGFKTEPAFAKYFNLPGDPYNILFMMSTWTDEQRREYLDIIGKPVVRHAERHDWNRL